MRTQFHQINEREALKIFEVIAPIYITKFPLVMKVSEIARMLSVSRETVDKWIDDGQFITPTTPGHYSAPALLYWLIKNEFIPKKSTEDELADQIAGEIILKLGKDMLENEET